MKATLIRILAVVSSIAAAPADATMHRVDWPASATFGEHLTATGPTLDVRGGVLATGSSWPVRVARVEIPGDARVSEVAIHALREDVLDHPAHSYRFDGDEVDLGEPDGVSGGYAYWILPEGSVVGYRFAQIAVAPFRSVDGEARFLASFDLEIETTGGGQPPLRRIRSTPSADASDARRLRQTLDAEPMFYPAVDAGRLSVPPEFGTETTEYVVITSASQAPVFEDFADIKTREGIPTVVTTIDWILANYEGIDLPARCRAYIRDLYLYQGLRFVMMAGDADVVPIPLAVNRFQFPAGQEVMTDKYYACLDGNWNGDGDAERGEAPNTILEIEGDDADLYSEVLVGRVPTGTAAEATCWLDKWKSYTGYDVANFRTDYQARVLALGEVLFPDDWTPDQDPALIVQDGADLCESTLTYFPPHFLKYRMYQYSENPEYPTAVPEIKDSVVVEINEGYGWVDHVGHGFRTNMSVGDGKLVNLDADQFNNTNAYSLIYAVNCTSGAVLYDCIIEHAMLNCSGGIVGGMASTDLDYPSISDNFKFEFFRLHFDEGLTTIGECFYAADLPWIPVAELSENSYRWTIMTLILFGDPSLRMWQNTPRFLTATHPATMELGAGTFTVTVTNSLGGSPFEGATVCLRKDDGYAIGTTDASGVATIDFLPGSTGEFDVTVVGVDRAPVVQTAQVVAPTSAALRVDGWVVHDGDGMGGTGNGDNRPDAGESILIDLTIRNDGAVTATNVAATLNANSPFIVLSDDTEASSDIPAGGMMTLPTAFAGDITAALPDTTRHVVAPATLDLSCDQGSWTEDVPFSLYQRLIDLVDMSWSIVDDDGNGTLEAGETAELVMTLFNRGEAEAQDLVGVGTYTGTEFFIADPNITFGTLAPGATVTGSPLAVLSTGGNRLTLKVDVTVSDLYASSLLSRRVDVLAPPKPDTLVSDPEATSIKLTWPPVTSLDVRGYLVQRADDVGGPYTEVSGDIIEDGSFYVDENLTPLTSYYYKVASVDSSGNVGTYSAPVAATTSPPVLEGWPVPLPPGESKGSPTFADVDYDSNYEVVLGWTNPMVFRADGGDFVDGDGDGLTSGIFATPEGGNSQFWNSPVVFDIDRDGVNETIFAAWHTTDEGHLYVIDATGAIESGWPQEIGKAPWSSPAIGDVDGDPYFEIFVGSGAGSGAYQGVLFGFNDHGSEVRDGDSNPATHGIFYKSASTEAKFMYSSPAIADLDDDGKDEIVFHEKTSHQGPSQSTIYAFEGDGSVMPGFPVGDSTTRATTSSPAIADIDGNGDLEIIAVTETQVFVLNHDGSVYPGWPKTLTALPSSGGGLRDFMSSPAVGDLDGDTNVEVVVGWLDGLVYAWTASTATLLPGFPADVSNTGTEFDDYLRSPIVGNIDADPELEVVISGGDARLHAVNHDGTVVGGFPISTGGIVFGSAAMWDLDQDGSVNLIVQTNAPELSVYDFTNVTFDHTQYPWPMFRNNRRKNGLYTPPNPLDTGGGPGRTPVVAAVHAARPNPFTPRTTLPFDVPDGGAPVSVRVFDVKGREVRVLADGTFPSGQFQINWDGRTSTGQRLAPGVYFARVEIGSEAFVQKLTLAR